LYCGFLNRFAELYSMATMHLWITGIVQGVYFRASAAAMAKKLHLNGWVKNSVEGAVEATVNGSDEAVEQFIAWCRKGPEGARVADVAITPKPDDGFTGFQVIR
jgi:acylphosphatase